MTKEEVLMSKLKENAVLAGYAVFIISCVFFALISIPSERLSLSLHELLSGFSQFLFWLVVLAGLAPNFIEHKYVSLAYALPLVFLVIGGWSAYSDLSQLMRFGQALGGQAFIDQMMRGVHFGAGLYLGLISAIVLAVIGALRTKKAIEASQ